MAANSNPHDNTYNSTTFSGPVKAGSRWEGANAAYKDLDPVANPIDVSKLANTGYVVCSQSAGVEQKEGGVPSVNNIVLPAGSMILSIQIIVTEPFDATDDKDLSIYCRPESVITFLTNYVKLGAVGVYDAGDSSNWVAGSWSTYVGSWKDISSGPEVKAGDSVDVVVDSGPGGASGGRAILTFSYIPGLHLLT